MHYVVERFDIVVSLFCSFSYAENSSSAIAEIFRVLNPGGLCYISMLNKFSLRRLLSMKFNSCEMYSTRRSPIAGEIPVNVFSRRSIRKMFQNSGFINIRIFGQGFFSGVFEHQNIWQFDKVISNFLPDLTHMITIVAQKPDYIE